MKILFICSSMQPGRDGVGDYTRRLGCELIKQGNDVAVIAINDAFTEAPLLDLQQNEDWELSVLRLPVSQPLNERLNSAQKYINEFNPEWISLQFVIFGYHPKGLPLWLSRLATLGKGRKWHIMFHELWLGTEVNATAKHLAWGRVQKYLIRRLINKLKPVLIHTHTQLYIQQLFSIGTHSKHLPLFGNIPTVEKKVPGLKQFKNDKGINLILFGHIHPNTPVMLFAQAVTEYAIKHQFETSFTLVGNNGPESENWIKQFKKFGIKVNVLGIQSASYISAAMNNANIGISTTPPALLEKSGSVAAMREHGLPIICVPGTWKPAKFVNLELPADIMIYKEGNLDEILDMELSFTSPVSLSDIGKQFINSMSSI